MVYSGDSIDSGLEAETGDSTANYVLVECRDRLEFTVSPQSLRAVEALYKSFTCQVPALVQPSLSLTNDITPASTATLLSKAQVSF